MLEQIHDILYSNEITLDVAILRMSLSFIAGGIVGIDREKRMHPAGLRTHTLICMGATLVMLISIYIPQTLIDFKNGDPGRIAAQAVSGIGFLGAGAIIKFGVNVKGLTTAASVWLISIIGLAIGCGLYLTSVACILFVLFVLKGLDYLEKRLFSHKTLKSFMVEMRGHAFETEEFRMIMNEFKIKILSIDLSYNIDKDIKVYNFVLEISDKVNIEDLCSRVSAEEDFISYRMIPM